MTAPAAASAPSVQDAASAAGVLLAEGAVEVLLYGSVARGDAHERSDIDLVAVFADIDYAERRAVRARLEAAAGAVTTWPVQVHVTDLPEWRARVANVTASFEHSISQYAVALAANGVHSPPHWDKMMEKPMNNPEEALKYFNERVINKLDGLAAHCEARFGETDPAKAGDRREVSRLRRMVRVCEDSAVTVELCLKALATLHGTHPPSEKELMSAGHDIERCLKMIPAERREAAERSVRRRGLDLAAMSNGRFLATYSDDLPTEWSSADDWAEDYAWTALAVAEHTLEAIRHAAGDAPALADVEAEYRDQATLVRNCDIRTGRRLTTDPTAA